MKSIKFILVITVLSCFILSCNKGGPWGIKGQGTNVTETKDLKNFDKIDLSIDADVFYTQDSVYKVEISAQQNILAVLKAEVHNGTLSFDYRRNVWKHNEVKITVHSPDLTELQISGSGDVNLQSALKTGKMKVSVSGSGDVYFPALNADQLEASISGSGDVKVAGGTVVNEKITISGSGNIDAETLQASSAVVKVSGTGKVTVNATEKLDVTISGSGDVYYKGNPALKTSVSGSGRLIRLN